MIEINIKIDEVDYGSAVGKLIPILLKKQSSSNPIFAVLKKIEGLPVSAAKAVLRVLPKRTQDELAVACLNLYSEDISKELTKLVGKNGIQMKVESVYVSSIDETE